MAVQYRQFPLSFLSGAGNLLADAIVATLHTASYTPNLDTHRYVSDLAGELASGSGYTPGGITLTAKTLAYLTAANWGKAYAASTGYTAGDLLQITTSGGTGIYRATTTGTSAATAPNWPTSVGATVIDNGVTWMCEGWGTGTAAVFLTWQASTQFPAGWIIRPAASNGYLYRAVATGTTAAAAPAWPTGIGQTVLDGSVTWECIGSGLLAFQAANPSWNAASFSNVRYVVLSDRTPAAATAQPLIGLIDFGSAQAGQGGAFTVQFNPEGALFIFMA